MAHVLYDDWEACDDCAIAIANNDYTGMDDDRAEVVKNAIGAIKGYPVIGDETGFTMDSCDICGSRGGDRHQVSILIDDAEVN